MILEMIESNSLSSEEISQIINLLLKKQLTPEMKEQAWVMTYTGVHFNIYDYTLDDIRIEDIAHSLAHSSRFNGHTRYFYSIAQHSYLVAKHSNDPLEGELHDAEEYIFPDISRPLKVLPFFRPYCESADQLRRNIFKKFYPEHPFINDGKWDLSANTKNADNRMLATEGIYLMSHNNFNWQKYGAGYQDVTLYELDCWTPEIAKLNFLELFHQLTNNRWMGRL